MQLTVIPYHKKVVDYFKKQTLTWAFFSKNVNKEKQLNELKTDLLKNTYVFDKDTNEKLYDKVNFAKDKLELNFLNVTIHQVQYNDELNASVVNIENEVHIIFSGPILKILNDEQILAVIAHELTHVKLYNMLAADLAIADRIITSIANSIGGLNVHYETARYFRLYTEIFCDRGAFLVTGKIDAIISSLVKMATNLENVNVGCYVRQAEEIFTKESQTKAEQLSHPENFIRARAIDLWHTKTENVEELIAGMIESTATLDKLDLFQQMELSEMTRNILQLFLKPNWFQTNLVSSLARQYFANFQQSLQMVLTKQFIEQLTTKHDSIKEYFAYVLFDFAVVDQSLEEIPLGWAFQFSEDLGIKEFFKKIVKKELQLTEKKLQDKEQKSVEAFASVKEGESEQIYE